MRTIFSWAEPLGVYGAHHVYNEIVARSGLEEVPEMPTLAPLPDAFETGFERDTLTLRSVRGGWSVRVPFWFMPFALSEFDTKNGPRTQLVMLGTGTSKHEGLPGHSQSTIRLFAGPGQVGGDFARYWRQALGFDSTSERIPLPIEGLTARKALREEPHPLPRLRPIVARRTLVGREESEAPRRAPPSKRATNPLAVWAAR